MTKKLASFLLLFTLSLSTFFAQGQQAEVSDPELAKFATVFQQLRMMDQEARQTMATTVAGKEMDIQRFNEIHRAELDPKMDAEPTEEEKKKYEAILTEIEALQADFQKKMQTTIQESGLSLKKYQQIASQLQKDPKLQERLKKTLQQ